MKWALWKISEVSSTERIRWQIHIAYVDPELWALHGVTVSQCVNKMTFKVEK